MSSQSLTLPRSIYDAIIAHSRQGKPEEVCGLLRGRQGLVTGIHPARNLAPDPILDYEVDAQSLLVQFDWEEQGDEMIAVYHSHPFSPAYPSASDAYNAHYPDAAYLICSLQYDDRPVLKGYYLRDLPGDIDLDAARQALPFMETRPRRWGLYLSAQDATPAALAGLQRPARTAVYLVYQEHPEGDRYHRAVSVQPVRLDIVD